MIAVRYTDPIARLAQELRRARLRSRMTRKKLAKRVGRSISTVQRAEAGMVRPTWPVTRAIASVCGIDLGTVERLWREAGRSRRTRLTEAPGVGLILTPADLAAALRRAWEGDGEPSLRIMEARAEARAREYTPLSRMSAWRIRERKQAASSLSQLYAYLTACQVPKSEFPVWAQAWHRAGRHETPSRYWSAPEDRSLHGDPSPQRAAALMLEAGLVTEDPFPGPYAPWTARCRQCGKLSRYRFIQVLEGTSCPVCQQPHTVGAEENRTQVTAIAIRPEDIRKLEYVKLGWCGMGSFVLPAAEAAPALSDG